MVLTMEIWSIVVNVDFSAYQDALDKLKDALYQTNRFKSRFAPKAKLGNLQKFRGPFFGEENQTYSFNQMLPRMDPTSGLVNVAGSDFKTLYGAANVNGYRHIDDTLNKLHDT